MPMLVLTFEGRVIREYAFLETGMTVGRSPDNAIVVDNLAVSGHHAKIEQVGTNYVLTDLQSTNGTFVNEKKVMSQHLEDGDSITIGKHTILFKLPKPAQDSESLEEARPSTMVLDTAKYKELLAKQETDATPAPQAPQSVPERLASSVKTPVPRWIALAVLGALVVGIVTLV